jgi:hypothetical protein
MVACAREVTSPPISPAEPLRLFNGKDLGGFYTWLVDTKREDPRHVFAVTNGMIRISGEGLGYLATEKRYQDYHLIAEFKWGKTNWPWGDRIGKARDSGIFLHAIGPDGNSHDGQGAFMAAIECNMFQGATGDLLLIRGNAEDLSLIAPRLSAEVADQPDAYGWFTWLKGGERKTIERMGRLNWFGKNSEWNDRLDFRGARDVEKPYGEWNRIECVCDGDRVQIRLNGAVVNEAFDLFPASGKILLQCEGSEVFFRRLELLPLNNAPATVPAGRRVKLAEGQLFIPNAFIPAGGESDVTLHLHGAPTVVERNFLSAGCSGVLVNVTLPGLSSVYTERFRDPAVFRRILDETAGQLKAPGVKQEPRFRRVTVSSFSAGFGGVRELLKNEEAFDRIDAVVMADSVYSGYTGDPGRHEVNPANMEGFLKFACAAAQGHKRMIISHSQQRPDGYASTTETADYLISRLGGAREPIAESWPGGLQLLSRFRKGELEIYGLAGDTAADHMKHLQNLSSFLERTREYGE